MVSDFSLGTASWGPVMVFLGVFLLITMWAVLVTEGHRKVKMLYYNFELAPSTRVGASLPDVEPYVPFNINPTGMQPVLTTTYLMALTSLVAKYGFSVSLPFTWFMI
jgi:preprotein translocase subunit SecY